MAQNSQTDTQAAFRGFGLNPNGFGVTATAIEDALVLLWKALGDSGTNTPRQMELLLQRLISDLKLCFAAVKLNEAKCVKAEPKELCWRFKRGFCSLAGCPHSHDVWDDEVALGPLNLLIHNALWCNLGKTRNISFEMKQLILNTFGEYERVDFVHMPGNPEKGGPYWCAVFYFKAVPQRARDVLFSGDCIHLKTPRTRYTSGSKFRFTLFRSEVKKIEQIRAKEASIAAQNAISDLNDTLAWMPFEIKSDADVWGGAMDYN